MTLSVENKDSSEKSVQEHFVRSAIFNNEPAEPYLRVIVVVSNPANFKSRIRLAKDFIKRMQGEPNVLVYVVELAYPGQEFQITQKQNPCHLQVRAEHVLWHKENLINMGVRHLLPYDWKCMAWIDADLAFESTTWASDALRLLNGAYDVVQLFSHACDMDKQGYNLNLFSSFGYCHVHGIQGGTGPNYPHPGYAWAITRRAYDKIGGVFQEAVLGSGDFIMARAFVGDVFSAIPPNVSSGYRQRLLSFGTRACYLRLGYVPGVIRHFFHGSKRNRKYQERSLLLSKWDFNPYNHIQYQENGLMVPSPSCPRGFLDDILSYSYERQEDDEQ